MGLYDEFRDHREDMRTRLTRIESKLDDHSHREYPTYPQVLGIVSIVASLVGGAVVVFA